MIDKKRKKENKKSIDLEQKRALEFENTRYGLIEQGYHEYEIKINLLQGNIVSFVMLIPTFIIFGFLFSLKHNLSEILWDFLDNPFYFLFFIWGLIILFYILIAVQILMHVILYALFCKNHFKSVFFGFKLKYLAIIGYCKEPLPKRSCLINLITPTILLGFLPIAAAIFNGSLILLINGILMLSVGSLNIITAIKLLSYHCDKTTIFLEHPDACGISAFYK